MNGQADAPGGGKDARADAATEPATGAAGPDAARSPAVEQGGTEAAEPGVPADGAAAAGDDARADEAGRGAEHSPAGQEGAGSGEAGLPADPAAAAEDAPTPEAGPGADGDAASDGAAPDDPAADAVDPVLLAEGARITEALIFASDRPVTPAMLGAVLPPGLAPGAVVAALAAACEGRGVIIAEVAGGWAFRTAPDLAQRLTKVVQAPRRLPRAAMEALSIIAYHQPCTRGEIEEIRGAALAQTTLEALLELGLVAPRGRREVPGRPTLWGTTPKFLEQFGLKALSDLPRKEELVTAETGPALPLGGPREAPQPPVADEGDAPDAAEPGLAASDPQEGVSDSDTVAGAAP